MTSLSNVTLVCCGLLKLWLNSDSQRKVLTKMFLAVTHSNTLRTYKYITPKQHGNAFIYSHSECRASSSCWKGICDSEMDISLINSVFNLKPAVKTSMSWCCRLNSLKIEPNFLSFHLCRDAGFKLLQACYYYKLIIIVDKLYFIQFITSLSYSTFVRIK